MPSGITIFVIQSPLNPKVSESVKITATASGNAALNSSRVIYVYIDDALANICTSSPCSTSPKKYSLGDHTYYAVINEKLVDLARDPVTGIKGFRVS
ncbi:TPA: hypothetical protein H1005_01760 [archaeon]|nr:hypothetical protein [Candidatus Naiadarchaeales archaeon SRR2090153.bin1042]